MTTFYIDSGGASTNAGCSDNNSATASGSANATLPGTKTFASATDVDTVNDRVTVTSHGYTTGYGVALSTSSALPGGLSANFAFYLRAIDANTLSFYPTAADAGADTNKTNITSNGTGTQTITPLVVLLGGSPDLSTINSGFGGRLTTTGTSHVITSEVGNFGLSDGDVVFLSGTAYGGTVLSVGYFVNTLSTSNTIRLYPTKALALAGGASTLNLTAPSGGTGIVSAANRWLYLNSATNSNRKRFPITGVDNTNKWAMLNIAPTGLGAGSDWTIGGRVSSGGLVDVCNVARHQDIIQLNTDISGALNLVFRSNFGGSIFGPFTRMVGKSGATRVLTNTGNGTLLAPNGTNTRMMFENIEFQSQGTGSTLSHSQSTTLLGALDCRFTDSGASAWLEAGSGATQWFVRCEFTGSTTRGIDVVGGASTMQCYIHDNTTDGVLVTSFPIFTAWETIFDRNAGRHVNSSPSSGGFEHLLLGCTLYHGDNSGLEVTSATPFHNNIVVSVNSIWQDNGNASGEFNVELTNGIPFISRDSIYAIPGSRGGANLQVEPYTTHSSDSTSDATFVDPDNGTVASRNFGLQAGSPALSTGYTFLGSGSVSYRAKGAVQPAASASATGHIIGGSVVR